MPELDLRNRDTLVGSFPHGGIAAEIGVRDGEFAKVILRNNKPRRLYLIDCWEEQSREVYGLDPSNTDGAGQQRRHARVLSRFAADQRVVVLKSFSEPAAEMFADQYFDWLYIDANHLRTDKDIAAWFPKIKPGGWLSGHDYTVVGDYIKTKPMVDRFVEASGLRLYVTPGEGYPSWAIQKE